MANVQFIKNYVNFFVHLQNAVLKCIPDHLEVHPKQFIYNMQNLSEIHSFDKVSKMKQVLGKVKNMNEHRIQKIYNPFESILDPIIKRVQ